MTSTLRQLGANGPSVYPIALGCMGMSGMYGPADETESIATIHAALDSGVNLLDTGDFYGMGHNELLLARALRGRRHQALLSVKFGALRAPNGAFLGFDGRPQAVKNFISYSLQRLNTDYIDIYRPARVDPTVPIEETIGAIAGLVRSGHVRFIGLSEAGAATLRRAHSTHQITDLQIEYSLASRSIEAEILPTARSLSIAITAYGVLSRGLLSGSKPTTQGDIRTHFPRFQPANYAQNEKLLAALASLAAQRNATPAQLAIAWSLAKGSDIIPVLGARTRTQLHGALAALDLELAPEEIHALEHTVDPSQVAGARYNPEAMAALDSER
jgi:aryl-alcohol dehydrogenase-like predicted oxidoreductase